MILIDANLLVYATYQHAFHHEAACDWLQETRLAAPFRSACLGPCILAFLRITTHLGIFPAALRPNQTLGHLKSWLAQPFVHAVARGERYWSVLQSLLLMTGSAGNFTLDAHVAALAIEQGAMVLSTDHDFERFPGVHHVNPLERVENRGPSH